MLQFHLNLPKLRGLTFLSSGLLSLSIEPGLVPKRLPQLFNSIHGLLTNRVVADQIGGAELEQVLALLFLRGRLGREARRDDLAALIF
jgi:hypothetical protein